MSNWFFTPFRLPETEQPIGCIVDVQADLIIAEVYELEGVNNGPLMACAPELLKALKYMIQAREIACLHTHPGPDPICAKCIAIAVIKRAEATHAKG